MMKTRIVRIGNSRGVRIPKPLLAQAGLGEEVELRVEAGAIRIEAIAASRAGWAEAAQQLVAAEGTGLLDEPTLNRFDTDEWEW
ncbi:MAG: AbrB/MazE/SpoVT family DNA-binding domain-containing protein [Gemmatimonadales bacterium]